MDDLWNQGWFALEMAWSRAKYEISSNMTLSVTVAAILILVWLFLSPQIRRKGS